jgi:hypothetical protein
MTGARLRRAFGFAAVAAVVLPACAGRAPVAQAPAAAPGKPPASSAVVRSPWPHRLVAVGDLHGDLPHTVQALKLGRIVDDSLHWIARSTVFVQTGDVMDRGDGVRPILDLLRRLEREADAAGGMAIALIGNHETFNLMGDQASASPADMASFGGEDARLKAFSPTGEYGAWLRTHKTAVLVDDTLFVHAGLTPEMAKLGLDAINAGMVAAVAGGPSFPFLDRRNGPVWFRGYISETGQEVCSRLDEALRSVGARRMVVGHVPSDDGLMVAPCGGRLIGIDTGISESYGIHVSALEIDNGDAWGIYPGGQVDLPDPD